VPASRCQQAPNLNIQPKPRPRPRPATVLRAQGADSLPESNESLITNPAARSSSTSIIQPTVKPTAKAAAKPAAKSMAKSAAKATTKLAAQTSTTLVQAKQASLTQVSTTANTAAQSPQVSAIPAAQVGAALTTEVPPPAAQSTSAGSNKRARVVSQRLAETASQALAAQATRVAVKEKRARRTEARIQRAEMDATVEQRGDSEEIRRLKGEYYAMTKSFTYLSILERLFSVEAERDHAQRQIADIQAKQPANEISKDSICRPPELKSFTVKKLREMLDLAGEAHDSEWNRIRVRLRSPQRLLISHCFVSPVLDHSEGYDAHGTLGLGEQLEVTTPTKAGQNLQCGKL
jgi:hypothetical protein